MLDWILMISIRQKWVPSMVILSMHRINDNKLLWLNSLHNVIHRFSSLHGIQVELREIFNSTSLKRCFQVGSIRRLFVRQCHRFMLKCKIDFERRNKVRIHLCGSAAWKILLADIKMVNFFKIELLFQNICH